MPELIELLFGMCNQVEERIPTGMSRIIDILNILMLFASDRSFEASGYQ